MDLKYNKHDNKYQHQQYACQWHDAFESFKLKPSFMLALILNFNLNQFGLKIDLIN